MVKEGFWPTRQRLMPTDIQADKLDNHLPFFCALESGTCATEIAVSAQQQM